MAHTSLRKILVYVLGLALVAAFSPLAAQAAPPVVKTVPWVATNPLIPHDAWTGKSVTLKGTCNVVGANYEYWWDYGDGSGVSAVADVTDNYALEARHDYTGATGTVFTARLTVRDKTTGETGTTEYYVAMRDKTLDVEVNVAIDEGLWYLHKAMNRYTSGGQELGNWWSASKYEGYANYGFYGISALNVNAFEVNGHLETGSPDNPYTETVARGLKAIFSVLTTVSIANQTNGLGTFTPDTNGNGIGLVINQSYQYYQSGMLMDAIIASGTPEAVTTTGPVNVIGRTYKDIIQDMADAYGWAQYDGAPGGGWRYNANEWPDNSACQWAAIGLIPAERLWGCTVPKIVKDWNVVWLRYSQDATTGVFGYTDPSPIWGPYATTPSGMVQLAMDGLGRGYVDPAGKPSWDKAETFIRNNFFNTGGATNAILDYYYGLFSFVKAMLLHDSNGDGIPEPLTMLQSQTMGVDPVDWYAVEAFGGDVNKNGVARTLVNDQSAYASGGGYWWEHNCTSSQYPMETAMAIIMLHRTIFEAGAPVAVAKAVPNPGVAGQLITLDGSGSFHQDASKNIDSWEWDLNNDGAYDVSGPVVTHSWTAVGDYVVRLRVSDDATPEKFATTLLTVRITTPPVAPTADAGGPYVFCPQAQPWFLDGRGSVNPDDGRGEPGAPGDFLKEYAWDLDGDGAFDDASGPTPDVTDFFEGRGPGGYLVQLRVTDNTAASFPSSGYGDLSSTSSAQVFVKAEDDPACGCIDDLAARAKLSKVQLTWAPFPGAVSYNVYRSTVSDGPYLKIANTTSTYCTYLDSSVTTGTTYFYVVRPAKLNGDEMCQSNEASATPTTRTR
jgi:hypothetical protein